MSKSLFPTLILGFALPVSVALAATDQFEGYYKKPVSNCWTTPNPPDYQECAAPVEDGVEIMRRNKSSYYMKVNIKGANQHFCSFQGIAHLREGRLVSNSYKCEVSVEIVGDSADINSAGEGCSNYCGARAVLKSEGLTRKVRLTRHSTGPAQKNRAAR